MSNKPFKTGIVVGRFQTFHKGHEFIIDKAVELCENVGILIGSSQESGTLKNPFTYETRERILKTIYGNSVEVRPLPDIGVGNNSKWGEYVLESYNREFKRRTAESTGSTGLWELPWRSFMYLRQLIFPRLKCASFL